MSQAFFSYQSVSTNEEHLPLHLTSLCGLWVVCGDFEKGCHFHKYNWPTDYLCSCGLWILGGQCPVAIVLASPNAVKCHFLVLWKRPTNLDECSRESVFLYSQLFSESNWALQYITMQQLRQAWYVL